jgi:hypothetical protein
MKGTTRDENAFSPKKSPEEKREASLSINLELVSLLNQVQEEDGRGQGCLTGR